MPDQVKAAVICHTARQLGVSEDQVNLDTVIPDIHSLIILVAIDTGKCGFVRNVRAKHTVADAIKMFE